MFTIVKKIILKSSQSASKESADVWWKGDLIFEETLKHVEHIIKIIN